MRRSSALAEAEKNQHHNADAERAAHNFEVSKIFHATVVPERIGTSRTEPRTPLICGVYARAETKQWVTGMTPRRPCEETNAPRAPPEATSQAAGSDATEQLKRADAYRNATSVLAPH